MYNNTPAHKCGGIIIHKAILKKYKFLFFTLLLLFYCNRRTNAAADK